MHINCNREILMENINLVQRAVSSKTTTPILECILLKCDDNGFLMFSTDNEIAIKTAQINCEIIEEGSIALPSKFFSEIIRKLPEGTVSIQVREKLVTMIKCCNSEFKIMGVDPSDFPEIEDFDRENKYEINQGVFKELIKRTVFSVCFDNTKPNLMGSYIEIERGNFNMVTCDAFRVSFASGEAIESDGSFEAKGVIVPYKAINEMQRLLTREEENMFMFIYDKHILFDIGSCTVFSRLIEGEFINYQGIFPDEFKTKITVKREEFFGALERAALVSNYENRKNPVRFKINKEILIVTTASETGNLYEELAADVFGDELDIAFNPRFLIDSVKSIDEDEITIELNSSLSPFVIKPVAEEAANKYLVLPLRLKS